MADDPAVEEVIRRMVSPATAAVGPATGDFQAAFDQAMREIARARLSIGNLQGLQTGRIESDYGRATGELGLNRDEILKALADRLASSGILRSGINIEEQGNIQRDYNRDLGELGISRTRGLEDLQENVKAAEQELLNREEQLKLQKAQWDSQQALAAAQASAGSFGPTGQFQAGGGMGGGSRAPQPVFQQTAVDRLNMQTGNPMKYNPPPPNLRAPGPSPLSSRGGTFGMFPVKKKTQYSGGGSGGVHYM